MKLKKRISWMLVLVMVFSMTAGMQTARAASPESDFVFASGAITGYTGQGGAVEIPSTIGGVAVTSIGQLAFNANNTITSVTIPSSVTSINNSAFNGCLALSEITIPNGVTTIARDAFSSCPLITSVYLPASVTTLSIFAFDACTNLTTFQVDSGNSYFSSLDGIIYDKEKKTLIMCPYGKTGSVVIPDGVTSISGTAFDGCTGIDDVTIPSGVTSIGYQAFYGCTKLTHVIIPATVTIIGSNAFDSCSKMDFAFFMGNASSPLGTNAFLKHSGFQIYNLTGSTGFTSDSWLAYSSYLTTLEPSAVAAEDARSVTMRIDPGDSGITLTQDILLSLVGGTYGLPITWTSSNPSIISISGSTGAVTRPAAGGVDTAVTLTATASCGGISQSHNFVVRVLNLPPETTAPTVTLVTPNSTGTAIGGNIAITFSEAMNTVNGAVSLSSDGGSSYNSALTSGSWSADNSVYTIAYQDLSYTTTYKIKIEGFQDTAGNVMSIDTSHSFTTAAKPLLTVGTGGGYSTLTAALAAAADGDTITLLSNITESASNTKATAGITVTIDGQGYTVTAPYSNNQSIALSLSGTGTVILKNLTLLGGGSSDSSIGLRVGGTLDIRSLGTVDVKGGAANYSYGLHNSSNGTVDMTAAYASGTTMGVGVANSGPGTVNVGSAEGGGAQGAGVTNDTGTINVTTATGSLCGVNNQQTGTVNVTVATGGQYGVYNANYGGGNGTVNVFEATSTGVAVYNDNGGTVNARKITGTGTVTGTCNTDVAAVILNKEPGASCVLNSITVDAPGGSTIGTLPSVYKNGAYSNTWYTDSAKTTAFSGTTVTGATMLYSSFYTADAKISTVVISSVTAPVTGATPVISLAETSEYTAAIAWLPAVSGTFAASTVYTATVTLTPKTGYTTTGVAANFFTVAGATATNNANSGVVKAVFPATAAADSGGGGVGGGGSSTTTPTATVSGSTAAASVPGTISGGTQTVPVPGDTMTSLTDAAKKLEATGNSATAVINAGSGSGLTTVNATIPGTQFGAFASGTSATLQITSSLASLAFSLAAVDKIAAAGSDVVTFSIGAVSASSLSAAQQTAVGGRPVYSFSVTVGGTVVTQLGGDVTVSIPYTLGTTEDPNAIVVYYLDASGTLQTMQGKYDAATKSVVFTTNHFSDYVVGYNKVSFTDVASGAWYADAVTFLAARGVTSGTTVTTFSPDATLMRGQFITMLLRAYGVESDANPTNNFSDAGDTYYTGYLVAAKKLGITSGIGNNKFAPDQAITRQEMFTMLYNALKVLDKLPEGASGKTLSYFTDAGDVASWASEAMTALVKAGTVSGSGGKLNPTGTTTRAEMAQALYNLLGK